MSEMEGKSCRNDCILFLFFLLLFPAFIVKADVVHHLERLFLSQDPDYGAQAPQLITSRGFGYEAHFFLSGGFINALHRIINPQFLLTRSSILMFHGITGASSNFMISDNSGHINEPDHVVGPNLAFELSKRGHDVWLLDQRATPFSANNTRYQPHEKEYWNWSLDEIALMDLPAAIDYVISFTGRPQIGYVGHSQGSQVMLMLLSRRPKYNRVIKPCILLAPTFYLGNTIFKSSPLLRYLPYADIEFILRKVGGKLTSAVLTDVLNKVCILHTYSEACKLFGYLHLSFFSFLMYPELPDLQYHKMPTFLSGGLYQTVSCRQLAQNIQWVREDESRMNDFSPAVNRQKYGSPIAPVYDPSRITCESLALFSCVTDTLTDPIGVNKLRQRLTVRPLIDHVIKDPSFGHVSFVFGSKERLVPYVIIPVIRILDTLY